MSSPLARLLLAVSVAAVAGHEAVSSQSPQPGVVAITNATVLTVTQGTIEERIQSLKAEKRALFDQIVGNFRTEFNISDHFSSLESLIKLASAPDPDAELENSAENVSENGNGTGHANGDGESNGAEPA